MSKPVRASGVMEGRGSLQVWPARRGRQGIVGMLGIPTVEQFWLQIIREWQRLYIGLCSKNTNVSQKTYFPKLPMCQATHI